VDAILEYIVIGVFALIILSLLGGFLLFCFVIFISPFALISAIARIPWRAPTHKITKDAKAHRIDTGRMACLVWQRDGWIDVYGATSCTWYGSIHTDKAEKADIKAEMERFVRHVPYLERPHLDKSSPPPDLASEPGSK
jgi:hypothetical protein